VRYGHGLVIGKFYPPHAGHHHLVRTAAGRCRVVTVVVLASQAESIPLEDRVSWLRAEHAGEANVRVVGDRDDHPVDYDDPVIWDAHVDITAAAVARAVLAAGEPPEAAAVDAVFSSEPYGTELARRFGAVAEPVDVDRARFPVSGTACRADLAGAWSWLAPATRAGLARRIVVLGAESSGTTTLAAALAGRLAARGGPFAGTRWVPEYGREHTVLKLRGLRAQGLVRAAGPVREPAVDDLCWTAGDFVDIAERQTALIDDAAGSGSIVTIADTDAFATGVWHERYRGTRSRAVEAVAARRPGHLYLVTAIEGVPFEDDGIRDGEHVRPWMHETFLTRLTEAGLPFHVVHGSPDERLRSALARVERHLGGLRYAVPLG
jgi:HTH-type transcriptional repressor of NAD biosynthesis genes